MTRHIMIDLETMDNKPTSAITAIGAVAFTLEEGIIEPYFYQKVDLQSSIDAGLTVSGSTVEWWLGQSAEARAEMMKPGVRIDSGLVNFFDWYKAVEGCEVWGNGASFDNPIMDNAYAKCGLPAPWQHFNHRCYRTIKVLARDVPRVEPTIAHHALHDAIAQAQHLINICKTKGIELK